MSVALSDHCLGDNERAFAGRSCVTQFIATVWAIITAPNLTAVGGVTVGWMALVAWTGNGPGGWQARSCVSFAHDRPSCAHAGFTKDQSRMTTINVDAESVVR